MFKQKINKKDLRKFYENTRRNLGPFLTLSCVKLSLKPDNVMESRHSSFWKRGCLQIKCKYRNFCEAQMFNNLATSANFSFRLALLYSRQIQLKL